MKLIDILKESKWHKSPSGKWTNMDPSDDDYEINYGKKVVNELDFPVTGSEGENIASFKPKEDPEALKRGYKSIKTTIEPDTGRVTNEYEPLPKFDEIRRKILHIRTEFQPFKFSSNEDISKLAKDVNTTLTKVSQMIFALDKMIELQKKNTKE